MHRSSYVSSALVLAAFVATACGSSVSSSTGGSGGALAHGVRVTRVEMNQAVSVAVMVDGNTGGDRNAPIVAGRRGLLRVYVAPEDAATFEARDLVARLDLSGPEGLRETLELTQTVAGASTDASLGSSFAFDVAGELVATDVAYTVSLHEVDGAPVAAGTTDGALFPQDGAAPLGAEASGGGPHIVIVPWLYGSDGSNRAPDSSDAQIERYRQSFLGMYPIENLDLTVRDAVKLTSAIQASGGGWDSFLQRTCALRQQDYGGEAPSNVFYFGIAQPAVSTMTYAQFGGYVAGLGVQASLGGQAGDMRCAVGLGYTGAEAMTTALHEVGHTFGRAHSPCVPMGGSLQGIDRAYPYANARIGVWGWDQTANRFFDPNGATRDIMGYCSPTWISDYTYGSIFRELQAANAASPAREILPPGLGESYRLATVDASGRLSSWGEPTPMRGLPHGEPREVTVAEGLRTRGATRVRGYFYPFGDERGGLLLVPASAAP